MPSSVKLRRASFDGADQAEAALEGEREAAGVVRRLKDASLLDRRVNLATKNVLAATRALLTAPLSSAIEDVPIGQLLVRGQRAAPVRHIMHLLRKLDEQPSPAIVVGAGRGARRSCRQGDGAATWLLGDEAPLTKEGLPAQPIVWRVVRERAVGAGCRSAVRFGNLLEAACGAGECDVAVSDMTGAMQGSVKMAPGGHWRRPYLRVQSNKVHTRKYLLRVALGEQDGGPTALRQPSALAVSKRKFAWAAAPKPCEGIVQLWMNYQEGMSSLHTDAPDGMLVCLGGERRVLLMPPCAPSRLELTGSTRGEAKFGRDFDAFALAERGETHGLSQVAELTPGMALFIPRGWWHQVRASAGSVAMSMPVVSSADPGESSGARGSGSLGIQLPP